MTKSAGTAMCAFSTPFLKYLRDGLVEENLSPARFQVLQALSGGEEVSMVRLAEMLSVTKRNITTLVDALEKEALVSRKAHPTDRRSKLVSLTKNGEETFSQVARVQQAHLEKLTAHLDAKQQHVLAESLSRLTSVMTEEDSPNKTRCPTSQTE
ncbi:MAG: MarR family winged helix-turn-helix transcriptional regulator [Candidatus Phaeomarinobacter sp.]